VKKTGDLMTGNLILSAYGGANRILGCTNLEAGRSFAQAILQILPQTCNYIYR